MPTCRPTLSGVVGRERMGTAFPHKKLSGNGVPTREILRHCFIIAVMLAIFLCYHVTTFRAPQKHYVKTGHHDLQSISALNLISKGVCSSYIIDRLYHKIHEFPLKLLPLTSGI